MSRRQCRVSSDASLSEPLCSFIPLICCLSFSWKLCYTAGYKKLAMTSTRKRAKVVSYVYDESDPESDYTPKIKRPAKRKKGSDSEYGHTNHPITGKATPHPVSRHIIKNTDDIRRSLLDWYSRVHENRGMPWRKPFDPSLDAKGRSQRAYEVRSNIIVT